MQRDDRKKTMRRRTKLRFAALAAALGIAVVGATAVVREARAAERPPAADARTARGEFDVQIAPLAKDDGPGFALGRMSLGKTFRGALDASAQGEMLTAMTTTPGSAVYVALERVTGTLDGRRGSFGLAHQGTMNRGRQSLAIAIVPDSGTGELAGIEGTLAIDIRDGKHYYVLTYRLPAS